MTTGVSKGVLVGVIVAAVFVIIGVLFLSGSAETLDRVAELLGAKERSIYEAPFPNYAIPGFEGNKPAEIALGVLSTLLVVGAVLAVGRALRVRR